MGGSSTRHASSDTQCPAGSGQGQQATAPTLAQVAKTARDASARCKNLVLTLDELRATYASIAQLFPDLGPELEADYQLCAVVRSVKEARMKYNDSYGLGALLGNKMTLEELKQVYQQAMPHADEASRQELQRELETFEQVEKQSTESADAERRAVAAFCKHGSPLGGPTFLQGTLRTGQQVTFLRYLAQRPGEGTIFLDTIQGQPFRWGRISPYGQLNQEDGRGEYDVVPCTQDLPQLASIRAQLVYQNRTPPRPTW